ncbi:MAG: hypothetical protein MZV70_05520 [Desulfobacterales bacterium]|nr:hypothetical protein [Desulfobacterales bacterium]
MSGCRRAACSRKRWICTPYPPYHRSTGTAARRSNTVASARGAAVAGAASSKWLTNCSRMRCVEDDADERHAVDLAGVRGPGELRDEIAHLGGVEEPGLGDDLFVEELARVRRRAGEQGLGDRGAIGVLGAAGDLGGQERADGPLQDVFLVRRRS